MSSLDIPTYFNKDTIDFIKRINSEALYDEKKIPISHVYGSLSGLFSARESERLAKVTEDDLEEHIKKLKAYNVDFYYALNTSCLGSLNMNDMLRIKSLLKKVQDIGVKNFIIAHPFLIDVVKTQIPDSKIKASVILEIDDIRRFKYFADKVDIINISTKVNRDFKLLEKLKDSKAKVEVLCNETCLFMCPFRSSHYTIESHRHEKKDNVTDYPLDLCYSMMNDLEIIKSRFILPEWIPEYKHYVKYFKISGRTFPQEFIFSTTESYSKNVSPENILDLFPIVTGSIRNEQSGIVEKRTLNIRDMEKKRFINYFIHSGSECRYKCPCDFCSQFLKFFGNKK